MWVRIIHVSIFLIHVYTTNAIAQSTPDSPASAHLRKAIPHRIFKGAEYHADLNKKNTIGYQVNLLPSWLYFDTVAGKLSGKTITAGQYRISIDQRLIDTIFHINYMLTVYDRQTVNILPLGNSITNGTTRYNSYRRRLWQLLHEADYNFDMIGSWDAHHGGGEVPDPDFDMDHDGHSGWTAHHIIEPPTWDSVRGNIDQWLKKYRPDIVMIELGTNDVFQCIAVPEIITNLNAVIKKCREKNSSTKFLLSLVPPLGKQWSDKALCGDSSMYATKITQVNAAFQNLSRNQTSKRSPVIIVDQFSAMDPGVDMYDDIHPNEKGENKMAVKWFNALKPFLQKLR